MFLTLDSAGMAALTLFAVSSFGTWLAKRLRHQH